MYKHCKVLKYNCGDVYERKKGGRNRKEDKRIFQQGEDLSDREDIGKPLNYLKSSEVLRDMLKLMAEVYEKSLGIVRTSCTNVKENIEGEERVEEYENEVNKQPKKRKNEIKEQ